MPYQPRSHLRLAVLGFVGLLMVSGCAPDTAEPLPEHATSPPADTLPPPPNNERVEPEQEDAPPPPADAPMGRELPMRPLVQNYDFFDTDNRDSAFVVLRSEAEEAAFVERYRLGDAPGEAKVYSFPEVDYKEEMAVVVALGMRASTHTQASIDAVVAEDGRIVVHWWEAPSGSYDMAWSVPAHIVAVPQDDRPVEFKVKEW